MNAPVLNAVELAVEYETRRGGVRSLDGATLSVEPGRIVAVVGESGSGKSTLGLATGRLLPANAVRVGGLLEVAGVPVFDCDAERLRELRRSVLGYVFQNPVAALDPTMPIARQLELAARHTGPADREPLTEVLGEVGLRDVTRVSRAYPHELSGGMAQRIGIAMALRRRPRLLVADEPTAAVDATLRAQILRLLVTTCRERDCALLLLTHDLHAVAEHAEMVAVMYGGRVVEYGLTGDVLAGPRHPYTRALIDALPGGERPGERLMAISGVPPVLRSECPGCAFAPRCAHAMPHCADVRPERVTAGGRDVVCHLHSEKVSVQGPPDDAERHANDREATR